MKVSIATILLAATSLVSAKEIRVMVGKAENGTAANVFTPDQVQAKVGDQIHFEFHPKNHTVTQSSFAEPCTRQLNTAKNELGVSSGFMSVKPDDKEIPVWIIEVKQDTAPIWMFCNQGNHCNSGMVFAINAPQAGEKTFQAFKEKAKTANHPNPANNATAPFTPPAQGTAPPAGTDAPPASSSDSAASSGSSSGDAPTQSPAGVSDPTSSAAQTTSSAAAAAATPPATADQANISPAASLPSTRSGALAAVRVPGAGVALTLAGLLAGLLL